MKAKKSNRKKAPKPVGYAVVGLGWIAQAAALPSFKNAAKNSRLVALVSGDPEKLKTLGRKYRVPHLYLADQFEACLRNPEVDAVYLALPNHLHAEYTELAARYGKHVLCEKPMALTSIDCDRMREACRRNRVRLMVAYRLHFEAANAEAIEVVRSEKIGTPRLFTAVYSYSLQDPTNYRLKYRAGGGPLFDIGIYCINAARHLFRSEPLCVAGLAARNASDPRFAEVEESFTGLLKFSQGRTAQFTCSFGANEESSFKVIGSKGKIELQRAFEIKGVRTLKITQGESERAKAFVETDQFGPEFLYFSDCILNQREPEPSAGDGLADVEIMEALYRSADQLRTVPLDLRPQKKSAATPRVLKRPSVEAPELVRAFPPAA